MVVRPAQTSLAMTSPTDTIKVPRNQLRHYRLLRQLSPRTCSTVRTFLVNHSQTFVADNRKRLLLCDRSLKKAKQIVLDENEEIKSIACGNRHTVALTNKGAVFLWGLELSNAPEPYEDEPNSIEATSWEESIRSSSAPVVRRHPLKAVRIFESGIVSIKCGDSHTLALDDKGKVYSWGSNRSGQLGTGPKQAQDNLVPDIVNLPKPDRCIAIAAGRYHSLALTEASGQVVGWGSSRFGQLGREKVRASSPELLVSLLHLRIKAIAAGGFNSAFLAENGALYVCGYLGCSLGDHLRRVLTDINIERIFICPFSNTERMFFATLKDETDPDSTDYTRLYPQKGRCYLWGNIRGGATFVEPKLSNLTPNEAILEYARQQRFPEMMEMSRGNFQLDIRIAKSFNCEKTSDVKFVFTQEDNKVFYAHRVILTVVNEYFATMLSGRWYKMKNVEINNWTYRLFYIYMTWIYLGEFKEKLSFDEARDLLDMSTCMLDAHFYKLCWDYVLVQHLTVRNACALYLMSLKYSPNIEQTNKLKLFIVENYKSCKRSSGYKKLPSTLKTEMKKLKHDDNPQQRKSFMNIFWPFKRQLVMQSQPVTNVDHNSEFF